MLLKINAQTIHDEHIELSLFLDYIWAFYEVRKKMIFLLEFSIFVFDLVQ